MAALTSPGARWRTAALFVTCALVLAACASSSHPSAGHRVSGGVVTLAESPGFIPTYIFPLADDANYTIANQEDFESLLFRPLYDFGSSSNPVGMNTQDSLAYPPVYSDNDRTVTVTLKHYMWSDGVPVTSRDIIFWMNLLEVETSNWGDFTPGEFPDNVTSYSATNSTTVVFHLTRAYNPQWFTDNQLAQITPLPQQAWDKTSASGPVGNYDETPSGAKAVYAFLNGQALKTSTYTTNPLWQVVDGPWKLTQFSDTGALTFVPNKKYSGPVKASLSEFMEVPFTSDSAEVDDLLSGDLSVGYLPTQDLPEQSRVTSGGKYTLSKTALFEINYIELNYENPAIAPLVSQLYIRQALQYVMDQPAQVTAILDGGGYPDYGPLPPQPANPYVTGDQEKGAYPFSVSKARSLLVAHGWSVPSSGAAVCKRSGTAPADCGAGIAAGQKLSLNLLYATGTAAADAEMANYKSDAASAGIVLNVTGSPINSVIAQGVPCSKSSCWQMLTWGAGGATWTYSPYPSGESQFETGAADNGGNYSDAAANKLIQATNYTSSASAMAQYDNYLTQQLPVIWQMCTYSYYAVKTNLHGVSFNVLGQFSYPTPENWYFTS
jgi:peptide/nickel transport system substrate-binding protein